MFHAIATDELGLTSVQSDAVFDSTKVNPRPYTYTLEVEKTDVTVSYDSINGAVANTALDGVLVIAAYNGNALVKTAIAPAGVKTISIAAEDISTATDVKAFVFENMTHIQPLTTPATAQIK